MKFRFPDRMIHFDPENPILNLHGPAVFGNDGPYRHFPSAERFGLFQALGKRGVVVLDQFKDVEELVETHFTCPLHHNMSFFPVRPLFLRVRLEYDQMMISLRAGFALMLTVVGSACGYTLQTSRSPVLAKEGVGKIYISPLLNNTYKSGAENLVYNALLKTMGGNRNIQIVSDPEQADAVLTGTVLNASFSWSSEAAPNNLSPNTNVKAVQSLGSIYGGVRVANLYNAQLNCAFQLTRRNPRPGQRALLWGSNFSRTKPFVASNQLGSLGTTSALINESEFDRTLGEMAGSMMVDVRESMYSRF